MKRWGLQINHVPHTNNLMVNKLVKQKEWTKTKSLEQSL